MGVLVGFFSNEYSVVIFFFFVLFFRSHVLAVSIQSGVVLCLSVGYSIHTHHFLGSGRKRVNGILVFLCVTIIFS